MPHTPQPPDRRRFLAGASALGATSLLGRAPAVLAQSKAPLKIGLLNSFSKVFAALGNANLNGMQLYFAGKLKFEGNQMLAMKLNKLFEL